MAATALQAELARFDPARALDEALTPPASWYTWPEFFELEQRTVFRRNWLAAARADQLHSSGAYVAAAVAGEPCVVVRTGQGQLRAFCNVCRHRATVLVADQGTLEQFVCPYHGWTYGLDGQLLRAPELGPVKNFDRAAYGLLPLAVEAWGPLVFLSLDEPAAPLAGELQPLQSRLQQAQLDRLQFHTRRHYRLACNWKVFVDNYLDGGYHVAHLHRGLAGQLDLQQYRSELFERFSIQSCAGNSSEQGAGAAAAADTQPPGQLEFAERIGQQALYAWIYPNLMINRYGPMMDINLVVPQSHDRCEVIFDYYFLEDFLQTADPAVIERSLAASDVVQQEDVAICQRVQQGLQARSYDRGPYSVKREAPQHHFHRLLAADFT